MSDEDIVISGVAGRFPSSKNVKEFEYNLFNKIDMTDEDESRWNHYSDEVPRRFGKIPNLEKFDASFFSTLNKHANWTDPQLRIILEHSYEAILDAGISPQSLIGSKTGVFIGLSKMDAEDAFVHRIPPKDGYLVIGCGVCYMSNRISYALGLCGPSFTVDTACSSSAYALDCAFRYMELGLCDSALVGGSQIILDNRTAIEYGRLGMLAKEGVSRPFDENASGYIRSETICVMFLQRRKNSKRIYANVVYSSTNNDGFKKEGSTFPSKIMQQSLMESFYDKIKFDPANVNYVEAHATSTKLGDPEELCAIDEVFNKSSGRSKTLTVGSVKSNMGHSEAASAMSSITKILLSFENQKFPPNINLTSIRTDIPAFAEGRIKVATEVEDLNGEYIAMNSFGLGGGNAHSLFKGNDKTKCNFGIPNDDLGRMVLWSGRTEAAINLIFDNVTQRKLDAEYIALLQNTQIKTSSANIYRGYGMFAKGQDDGNAVCVKKNIQHYNGLRRPVVFMYSGIGSQWIEMGRDLMKIPLFAQSIEQCHDILMTKGIDLKNILTSTDVKIFDNVLHSYVGIVAIEIALTDILKKLNIIPDFIIGHSVGEICCAYADNCFTAEEAILTAHARGEANVESKTILGAMAAVGLSYSKLNEILPKNIDIACHNAEDSHTISGPAASMYEFMKNLKQENILVKEVASSGVPFHSRYIKEMGQNLYGKLKEIIKDPKQRTDKWLSSTYDKAMWSQNDALLSSAKYHTNNLLNPVLFNEVTKMLPSDSLIIEVAPSGLLRAIIKRSLKNGAYVNLTDKNSKNGFNSFMEALGSLFQHGIDMDISKLYPSVSFPVSRGTPMISPIIKWNHEDDHFVPYLDTFNKFERHNVIINISDKNYEFVKHHVFDGRVLFPATGWVFLVWETFSNMNGIHFEKNKVILENVQFLSVTPMENNQDIVVTISIHRASGQFEIIKGNTAVAKGTIKQAENIEMSNIKPQQSNDIITGNGICEEFRVSGMFHSGPFQGVTEMQYDGLKGKVKWLNNWTAFLGILTHFNNKKSFWSKEIGIPVKVRKLVIDPILHYKMIEDKVKQLETKNIDSDIIFDVIVCPYRQIINGGGVEFHGIDRQTVQRRMRNQPLLEIYKFIPHFSEEQMLLDDAAKVITQIIIDKNLGSKVTIVEFDDVNIDMNLMLSEYLQKAIAGVSQFVGDITLVTSRSDFKIKDVTISTQALTSFSGIDLLIKSNLIKDLEIFDDIKAVMKPNGIIISRESQNFSNIKNEQVQLVAKIPTKSNEILHILQFVDSDQSTNYNIIEITSDVIEWLEPLQNSIKKSPTIIYAYNREPSGILGFFKCLKLEYQVKVKCFFIIDTENSPPAFDINNDFFAKQLAMNHTINIFKDGKWGDYRHLNIPKNKNLIPQFKHCYAYCRVKGDLSSLTWMQGPLEISNPELNLINIQYASLSFKDIMLALGKITIDIDESVTKGDPNLGFEFSGTKQNGQRVMGISTSARCLATHYDADNATLWNVPDSWTLEEAATVPLVYFTVYFAFFNVTTIKAGKTILIHSGTGGIGQAAITVALAYGLEVFTTVSSEEKKNFLLKKFPIIKSENIGNSRNLTFEKMVLENTNGKGVNYVLNPLAGERLQASIRCLAVDGVFLEIGKYDIQLGANLDMKCLSKRITIKAVIFDDLAVDEGESKPIYDMIEKDLESGIIKPLNVTVFDAEKIEDAFRFMLTGYHIGKVVIKMRQNPDDKLTLPLALSNRVFYNGNESIIIPGGLGGFGLELIEWLILRGCRKFILSSRRGISNDRQKFKIKLWESLGVKVIISTANITTEEGCLELIKQSIEFGPVAAIYNLAGILRDKLFDDINVKAINECLASKAIATKFLDKVSRILCPNLKHFVVFSSIVCGRGNVGQTNYGMSNSVMERIIEERQRVGHHGKAIQWGAIADVGMFAEAHFKDPKTNFHLSVPQPTFSCFEVFDELLLSDEPIVSSFIVPEKKVGSKRNENIIDTIFNIMGIQDRNSISMFSTLSQLGMDSLTGVEIQQTIDREFNISMTSQELRSITLTKLAMKVSSKTKENFHVESNLENDDNIKSCHKKQ